METITDTKLNRQDVFWPLLIVMLSMWVAYMIAIMALRDDFEKSHNIIMQKLNALPEQTRKEVWNEK